MFVSKRVRDLTAPAKDHAVGSVGVVLDEEAAEMKRQAELEERRRQSTFLASESIKRELVGKETEDRLGLSKTDDTDGADPEGEFEAWKLRELMRIKREKEAGAARSAEREALEARRALPEALRLKEDTEHAAATRAAKAANRGQQGFLQKYHHKGAFFADDEILQRYDYTAPTEGETIRDVSSLPKVMQVRNYGKMGRTKYTHLADQDTSDRNVGWGAKPGQLGAGGRQGANSLGQGCFNCGGNHVSLSAPHHIHI
jgi:microfibrillar-associated protein 1